MIEKKIELMRITHELDINSLPYYGREDLFTILNKNDNTNTTKKTKNNIFAIPAESAATPEYPKNAATNANIKNINAQSNNIGFPFFMGCCFYLACDINLA